MNKAIILLLILTVLKLFSQKENKDASEEYEPVYISKKDYEEAKRIVENDEPVYVSKEDLDEARRIRESGECVYCN